MFTVLSESKKGGEPPEPEPVSAPDGDPGRSPFARVSLVSDGARQYADQQTGVSVACNPTDEEVRAGIRKLGFLRAADRLCFLLAAVLAVLVVVWLARIVKSSAASSAWITVACDVIVAAAACAMPFRNVRDEEKRYRAKNIAEIEIYPDRLVLKPGGETLPLDGTAELHRTPELFVLAFRPETGKFGRPPRYVILPFRCLDADVLPYAEAMLAAGAKPGRAN